MENHYPLINNFELKFIGFVWYIYYDKNSDSYFKVLKKINPDSIKTYQSILLSLKEKAEHMKSIPKILNIFSFDDFFAYQMEKRSGIPLHEYMIYQSSPLETFYQISKILIPIIQEANEYNMVLKDFITYGNILYDRNKNQISIIDLDSIQINNKTDHSVKSNIYYSSIYQPLLKSTKYKIESTKFWKPSFNIFLFYELFLNLIFGETFFFPQTLTQELPILFREILERCGIPESNPVYHKILDLADPFVLNTLDLNDFKKLASEKFDFTRKRIIL